MNRHIDADQALAGLDRSPVVLKNFQGRDWELFVSMPAKTVFKIMRLQASGRGMDEMSGCELLTMAAEMVPPAVLDAWLEGGMTTDETVALMGAIIATYAVRQVAGPKPLTAADAPSYFTSFPNAGELC